MRQKPKPCFVTISKLWGKGSPNVSSKGRWRGRRQALRSELELLHVYDRSRMRFGGTGAPGTGTLAGGFRRPAYHGSHPGPQTAQGIPRYPGDGGKVPPILVANSR